MPQSLNEILESLNRHADGFKFGKLQDIRKTRRPLQRKPCQLPFRLTDESWARHVGGQKEIQFNISVDEGENLLRWGIALSLQPCRAVPDVSILYPKLRKLSALLENYGEHFHRLDFNMWDWTERGRSPSYPPRRVAEELYNPGSFVVVGKLGRLEEFDPMVVLHDFDTLLPVYETIEFETRCELPELHSPRGFVFQPDPPKTNEEHSQTTRYNRERGVSHVSLRHRMVQKALKRDLEDENAEVATENPDGRGGFIDLVARRDDGLEFYEIKTDSSARLAIRNAMGQLLEYAYWPEPARPKRLFIVSEQPLDADADRYLRTLEEKDVPIGYRQIRV